MTRFDVSRKVAGMSVQDIIRRYNKQELYEMARAYSTQPERLLDKSVKYIAGYVYDCVKNSV